MQPDLENLEQSIDRDKRDRERELLALLLLLFLRARQYAYAAIRLGTDPFAAMAAVIMGNASLGLPGGIARMAAILAAADLAGFHRTELVLPGDKAIYQPGVSYRQTAGIALAQMLGMLQRRVGLAFATARGGTQGLRQALREAFRTGGYVEAGEHGAWHLRGAAENLVGPAYNAGQFAGWQRSDVKSQLTGFKFSAILDEVTTEICRPRDGVSLPANDPWWNQNWPALHFSCRSVVLPRFDKFTPTENPPYTPPPMAGFGRAPFAAFNLFRPAA